MLDAFRWFADSVELSKGQVATILVLAFVLLVLYWFFGRSLVEARSSRRRESAGRCKLPGTASTNGSATAIPTATPNSCLLSSNSTVS